ncbi:hypothetical protein N7E81_00320 [Reichenbachiella carrageenanivorans]|uniref:Gingipain propeptide domain-containing protein n=1 Tax=Reichenbachiella carrageenanivorans TaxID=2979869 RepID=A0ABY6D061_9BACT|nr:hypothetical protein [Reichenbachiella carrageenanivorans]UXX79555.1 hypothetical protein N7E81_00320 [Reichenbachiella carrageenanivorans]
MYRKQAGKTLLILFLINALLVSTHLGEFWPFSIYPMFSKAGKPWTRALIRDVSDVPDSLIWQTYTYPDLPGIPATTLDLEIDNIDYSNFVCKTKNWQIQRVNALRYMIGEPHLKGRKLLAVKVSGRLMSHAGVETLALPFILFDEHGYSLNPTLDSSQYFTHETP